jgi:hypothetical protein
MPIYFSGHYPLNSKLVHQNNVIKIVVVEPFLSITPSLCIAKMHTTNQYQGIKQDKKRRITYQSDQMQLCLRLRWPDPKIMLPPMMGKSIPRCSLQPCTDLRK